MKKFILISAFLITSFGLVSQTIQMDIPGDEIKQETIKSGLETAFLKQPYLIFEGINTQMRVIWQLDETAACEISWGDDNTYGLGNATTSEYGNGHQHSYTIEGLTPGTKYYYKVEYLDATHEASFVTAPEASATNLKFFVYGDTRSDVSNHNIISGAMISDYTADPDFQTISLFTGDHVTYGAAESSWQGSFFSPATPNIRKRMAEVPFISCLGNHELYLSNYSGLDYTTALYGKYFPFPFVERRYWSFDYGPMHVTVLDQYPDYYVMIPPNGYLDSAQMAWVEEDLSSTDKPWKVIIMHEPGWSCEGNTSGYSHPNNLDVQNLLQPLCEQYGVQIVFSAHNHYYARACKNGVYHITTAGGGAPLYEVEEGYPNVLNTEKTFHYCKVVIEGGEMQVTAITPFGGVIDEFLINQNERPNHILGFLAKDEGPGNISDVLIETEGQSISPDVTGYFGLQLEAGMHGLSFTLENYYTIDTTEEVYAETETQLDLMMSAISSCLPQGITFSTQQQVDNFPAFNPECGIIQGNVEIKGEGITNLDSLSGVYYIGGDLVIQGSNALENLAGLGNLTGIGGNFQVLLNENIVSFEGLNNLETIGNGLIVAYNDALENFSGIENLNAIGGDLVIELNASLTSLMGLQNIQASSIIDISITDNASLSECGVESICSYLIEPNGTIKIEYNANGCSTLDEVEFVCATGLSYEYFLHDKIVIFPNPVFEHLSILFKKVSSETFNTCLYNTTGICLKSWEFKNQQSGTQEFTLDLSNLPPGIYFLRLQAGNEVVVKKVVKL